MKIKPSALGPLLVIVVTLVSMPAARAQSQNARALSSFALGLKEKEPHKKIAAYAKAIEHDPQFVEALYNLGLAYGQVQDHARAELFFLRALNSRPERTKSETKVQILLELARTEARLSKTKEQETFLRSAKDLATETGVRAAIIWELCSLLREQGRDAEALAELEEGQRLNSAKASEFSSLAQKIKTENVPAQRTPSATPGAAPVAVPLDSLYQAAVRAQVQKDWLQAIIHLEKLQLLQANYRDTAARLVQARSAMQTAPVAQSGSPPWAVVAGLAAMAALLPLLGLLFLSPAARARYYLLRNDYVTAAQIYDQILRRHPQRTRIYPALGNLYLQLGRRDERALKIYKTILQLNLPTPYRDHINAIVAEQFLTEGRTDSDAIAVLESALEVERRRLRA